MLLWRDKANLWTLILPPTVWAVHFTFSYVAAAVACARDPQTDLNGVQIAVGLATLVALAAILLSGWQAVRHWGFGSDLPPHDQATDEDRQRFLGLSTLLVSALSAIAVVFAAFPVIFITDCR
ncbi:hypothetical protein [Ancylobacter sp. SL191]|uniref:hypothetical protein n=1 Tax=Ancylobacter sp. SL191 TaxID=2995166 RepID=UPI00226F9626|nr:hypothetical protein [Ancylobacter sp. SL191]WAC27180.1 hypothetical protein OU996_19630 [Ancylobacter sp. SL191]